MSEKMKRVLITGITGQDGTYLSKRLLKMGYEVIGTSRDSSVCNTFNLEYFGLLSEIKIVSMNLADYRSVIKTLKDIKPDQIYNLGGLTSVGLSFEQPVEAIESISYGILNILEAVKTLDLDCKVFNPGSSECFGNIEINEQAANENTSFKPRSPYAIAKATAFWYVKNYRETYGIKCMTGILSNHESPLRPRKFVLKKITCLANEISKGLSDKIVLGNIDIERDWGLAEEYVQAIVKIMYSEKIDDYIIASGKTTSLKILAMKIFEYFDLNLLDHLIIDKNLYRPYEIPRSALNPNKIYKNLSWKANASIDEIVKNLCEGAS